LKATTGTGAMAASATISVTTCACHLKRNVFTTLFESEWEHSTATSSSLRLGAWFFSLPHA